MTPSRRFHPPSRVLALLVILFATVAAAPARDDENKALPPLSSDDLSERAARLFDAIKEGRPELAEAFFFPREPFLSLKDVHDPGRYHSELVSAYRHDIRELHAARKNWDGAEYRALEIVLEPKRVPPGHEWNKIGYFRTIGARLEYDVQGRRRFMEVHTLISWDGRWYVTHLAPIRH
jgi:hypothetical protein